MLILSTEQVSEPGGVIGYYSVTGILCNYEILYSELGQGEATEQVPFLQPSVRRQSSSRQTRQQTIWISLFSHEIDFLEVLNNLEGFLKLVKDVVGLPVKSIAS